MLGVGGFGETWRSAMGSGQQQIVALIDGNENALREAKRHFGLADDACFRSIDEWGGHADLLIDSTPPNGRLDRLKAAAPKAAAFVIAKPLAWSTDEGRAIQQYLEPTGARVAWVAMQKRYLPAFTLLQQKVQGGAVGKPGYLRLDVEVDGTFWQPGWEWRQAMAFPSLWEGVIHQLDLAFHWMEELKPVELTAVAWNPSWSPFSGQADVSITIRGAMGEIVQILSRWSRLSGSVRHYFSGVRLEGPLGCLEVTDGKLFENGAYVATDRDGVDDMDLGLLNERLMRDLVAETAPASLGLPRQIALLGLLDAIEQSVQTGRTVPVRW